jgi:negative regulator of flagellin synthesis FlgM
MAVKIDGNTPFDPMGQVRKTQAGQTVKSTDKKQPSDRVDFSTVLQEVSSAKETGPTGAISRSERVESLKEQIANGTYNPDLVKVAASLLKFIVGGRG